MTIDTPEPDPGLARNLELKVEVMPEALTTIREILTRSGAELHDRQLQDDTYFAVPAGRLKLRTITGAAAPARAELIGYRRGDVAGSRWSDYQILPLTQEQADALAAVLGQAMNVWVRVRKRRDIYLIGATRIHLDDVDQLGAFVELETVVSNQSLADAEREHNRVVTLLALDGMSPIPGSYSDLLAHRLGSARADQ